MYKFVQSSIVKLNHFKVKITSVYIVCSREYYSFNTIIMLYNNISFRICGCQQYYIDWSEHDLHQRESSTGARIYTQNINITYNFANPIMNILSKYCIMLFFSIKFERIKHFFYKS